MRRFRQLIAAYLVVSFAFAGAVGISPVLHRLIEHGGHGPAHTHSGVMPAGVAFARSHHDDGEHGHHHHDSGHAHPHYHDAEHGKRLFANEHGFDVTTAHLAKLWHALTHFLAGGDEDSSSPSQDAPGHTHDSLPQLLVNGMVEHHVDPPLIHAGPVACADRRCTVETVLLVHEFDPQTASRPPPAVQS